MAEDQNDCNNAENGQIPEEKVWEMSNRDEFGDYNTETGQVARDQQQNQGHTDNNQEPAGNNSGARDATEPNPGQSNQGNLQANTGRPDGTMRGSSGRGFRSVNTGIQRGGGRGVQDAAVPNPGQSNLGNLQANRGGPGGIMRGSSGRGFRSFNTGIQRGGGQAGGPGGLSNNLGGQLGVNLGNQFRGGGYGRYQPQHVRFNEPYGGGRGQQNNYNFGQALFDMIPNEQNYVSEGLHSRVPGQFQYPTNPAGSFAHAMSQVTCNPTTANQGTVPEQNLNSRELFDQLQMALSAQLGFSGPQQVNERALHNVITSPTARVDMKQIIRARAELYGDELEPKLFKQGTDLGGKATTLKERNQARAQLAGAPLLVAQLSEMEFRLKLMEGDNRLLQNLRMGT